ncbi:uncharacterized protein PHACADRAFT_85938 [Phanerochaete carnosa HHB-10118-sp]|uniref:Anaphase-promoting complex subunit 4 WD40 domain-containing protein n=1 Tax=Phanerochaete carnosa (strain HHB-10118-sp) TaxID=650164 RepID=K5WHL7_PHACS|nr:uncharacterized protein PHACADRAFT_85938 [Phanerochaete carnosa HHB-10118-sp]EKM58810.1 hypothetical protein PHACADRAFT_85938 [Phanerochaete carnosa HHB-10118-sp]
MKLKQLIFADSRDPSASCKCFSLSTDDKLLAASFGSGDVLVWRISDGLLAQRLHHQGHTGPVRSIAFSPDDRSLVSGSDDATAIVWDIRHGRALLRLEGHHGPVKRAAYAPHGVLIATASPVAPFAKIWDALTGACLHSLDIKGYPLQISFSPSGSHLYIDINSCFIFETQNYTHVAELQHEDGGCESSLSRQGDRIVTASMNDQVKIWSALNGEELLTIDHPEKLSYPVAFSPDGTEILAARDADNSAVTFDSRTGELLRVYKLSEVLCYASYSTYGERAAFAYSTGDLQVRDTKSGAFLAKFEALSLEGDRNEGPWFSFGGQNFVVRFSDGLSLLHNIQDVLRLR